MTATVNTVDQAGVRALIKERLEHPELYADKPLFIWQAEWLDGIQQQLVINASLDFNKGKAREDWSYFRLITVRDENAHLKGTGAKGGLGGYVISTRTLPLDEYLNVVCKLIEENNSALPLIVYLPYKFKPMELPGEQYVSDPDFECWAKEWADSAIPDFIRGDGEKAGIIYRWFNRYNDPDKGCSEPRVWLAVGAFLNSTLNVTRNYKRDYGIRDLSENLIRQPFGFIASETDDRISTDVIDNFVKYLKNNG